MDSIEYGRSIHILTTSFISFYCSSTYMCVHIKSYIICSSVPQLPPSYLIHIMGGILCLLGSRPVLHRPTEFPPLPFGVFICKCSSPVHALSSIIMTIINITTLAILRYYHCGNPHGIIVSNQRFGRYQSCSWHTSISMYVYMHV